MANNRIQLNIAGMSLLISTPEDEEYVKKLAEMIERDMQNVLTQNGSASVANTAILCALDYLDRFHKANRSAANMRAQIKEYLTDAANAKLLFDGEKKRADALSEELKNLRGQIGRKTDDERSAKTAKSAASDEELVASSKDIDALRREYDAVASQCQSLTDRIRALNDYITNQDNEITRLKTLENEQHARIQSQTQEIEQLEGTISDKQSEIEHLVTELKSLEKIVSDDMSASSKNAKPAPVPASPARRPTFDVADPERTPFTDDAFSHFRDSYTDVSDVDDMPDLDWTKDI